jgi:PKHD-type hydroxylase|tara:strand:- start:2044 stop:2622 length:579 start_codon:yes stop_codon:yes gene_type:complete
MQDRKQKFDYWFLENVFSKKEIKNLNKLIKKNLYQKEPEKYAAKNPDGSNKKFVDTSQLRWASVKNYLYPLYEELKSINNYNFGYHIFDFTDQTTLNYNVYSGDKRARYDWHADSSDNPLVDTKVTVLINLSPKEYVGGDFLLFSGVPYKVPELNSPGNLIMFKSYLQHKVEPVTKGERIILSLFCDGKAFV